VHRDGEKANSKSNAPLNPDDWNSDAVLAKLTGPSHAASS
jgi:hemoglobin/transferrin/lactoferrin receptor protein